MARIAYQITSTHVVALLILLLVASAVTFRMTHSRGDLDGTLRFSAAPHDNTFFELPSSGKDGDGQRTIG